MSAADLPLDGLRDSVAWPVLPVTPPLPIRVGRDLEPFVPEVESTLSAPPPEDQLDVRSRRWVVGDLMRRQVITIEPERTLAELEALLLRHRISGVPVTEDDVLLGVVTQADLIRHHFQEVTPGADTVQRPLLQSEDHYHLGLRFDNGMPAASSAVKVREVMTPFIYYATEDTSIPDLIDMMLERHIHRVVITRDRKLVGVVTSMDLLSHYRQGFSDDGFD